MLFYFARSRDSEQLMENPVGILVERIYMNIHGHVGVFLQ